MGRSRYGRVTGGICNFTGIKLRNSVKFRGIPLNTEFRKILIPPELFLDGIMDTRKSRLQWEVPWPYIYYISPPPGIPPRESPLHHCICVHSASCTAPGGSRTPRADANYGGTALTDAYSLGRQSGDSRRWWNNSGEKTTVTVVDVDVVL